MAKLKCYSCPECGSFLEVDRMNDTFDCPFCGTHFEAFDFHGEDLLEQAKTLLRKNDFRLAREKYEFLLSKNPERFEYLYGYACAVSAYSSLERFKKLENYDDKLTRFFAEDPRYSNGPYADYFAKYGEMFEISKRYEAIAPQQEAIKENAKEIIESVEKDKSFPSLWFWIFSGVYLVAGFPSLSIVCNDIFNPYNSEVLLYLIMGLVLLFPILVFRIAYLIYNQIKIKPRAKEFEDRLNQAANLKQKVKDLEAEKEELDKAHKDAVYYLETYSKQEDMASATDADSAVTSKFTASAIPSRSVFGKTAGAVKKEAPKKGGICKKCGAELKLDKVRKLYICDHCGSSYDFDVFLGDPIDKATKSLNSGDFDLADKWFSMILAEDPSDFEGLRGRILCAGKWHNTAQINLKGDLLKLDWEKIQKSLDDAIANASESDREYFVMFDDLTKVIREYIDVSYSFTDMTFRNNEIEKQKQAIEESFNEKLRPLAKIDIERVRELRKAGIRS